MLIMQVLGCPMPELGVSRNPADAHGAGSLGPNAGTRRLTESIALDRRLLHKASEGLLKYFVRSKARNVQNSKHLSTCIKGLCVYQLFQLDQVRNALQCLHVGSFASLTHHP